MNSILSRNITYLYLKKFCTSQKWKSRRVLESIISECCGHYTCIVYINENKDENKIKKHDKPIYA